jgi:hypothetical protein
MGREKNNDRVPVSKVDEAIKLLQDLKPKERDDISALETVRKLRRYIEKLTSKKYGYTFDEVSEMLQGLGINLSGSRIKTLLAEVKKNTRSRKKPELGSNSGVAPKISTQAQDLSTNSADGKTQTKKQ